VPLPSLKTDCGRGCGMAACPALGLLVTSDYNMNTLSVWGLPGGASRRGGASGGAGASALAGAAGAGDVVSLRDGLLEALVADVVREGLAVGAGASARAGAGAGGPGASGRGLRLQQAVCTLGGDGSAAPMQFMFFDGNGHSGYLAFTPPTATTSDSSSSSAHPLLLVTDAGHDAVHIVDVVGRSHAGYIAPPGPSQGPGAWQRVGPRPWWPSARGRCMTVAITWWWCTGAVARHGRRRG
jgi:hypothetical protein